MIRVKLCVRAITAFSSVALLFDHITLPLPACRLSAYATHPTHASIHPLQGRGHARAPEDNLSALFTPP